MAINWTNMKKLRNFIAKLPEGACDMDVWQCLQYKEYTDEYAAFTFKEMKELEFECGSAACIGGWAEMIANQRTEEEKGKGRYITAQMFLGLNHRQKTDLFYVYPDYQEAQSWKDWMVKRLDGIIKDKKIRGYAKQMDGFKEENDE